MKFSTLILVVILGGIVFGCKKNNKEQIVALVSEWQGREIYFPENATFTIQNRDTVNFQIPKDRYKILIFVDSLGCTSCKLQLNRWKNFIAQIDSITDNNIPFLFFFQSDNNREISYILKRDRFDLPVCIDPEDQLNKLNNFPSDMTFQTFLLNAKNIVEVIGNPIHNPTVMELYLKQILGKTNNKTNLTTAFSIPSEADLGVFKSTEVKDTTFIIKNTGDYPLVITNTATTCSCASITINNYQANPGEELMVSVKMQSNKSGFFDETITLKCNTNKQIKQIIKGEII